MIGLILIVLAAAVLFGLLPGGQVAWFVVLVCGIVLAAGLTLPPLPWRRA